MFKKRKRVLIQCRTLVDRAAVSRKTIDGIEHVVIVSHTLPDNIVMNGGLYPADEVAKSFTSLERTLAPVEHPTNSAGRYISASDPTAIHNFYVGAFNENVRHEDGRVYIDKMINVQEARKTDKGKRLLDRIEELENNDDPRPIHTSVGVFLEMEETDGPQTNDAGDEYTWIARNMVFDHDAILLDSVGAAQPHQGVGMAVNADGDELEVQRAVVTSDAHADEDMSHSEIRDALDTAIRKTPLTGDWVVDVFEDTVVFMSEELYFSAPYIMEGRIARIVGIPLPVERDVTYVPKTNQKGDAMKDLMLAALAAADIKVNAEITDDDLMAKYNELQASQNPDTGNSNSGSDDGGLAEVVANAIKPLTDKLESLETKIDEQGAQEADQYAEVVGNSDKYPGLDVEAAKKLPTDTLKSMAANCAPAYGVPLTIVNSGKDGDEKPLEMPK